MPRSYMPGLMLRMRGYFQSAFAGEEDQEDAVSSVANFRACGGASPEGQQIPQ